MDDIMKIIQLIHHWSIHILKIYINIQVIIAAVQIAKKSNVNKKTSIIINNIPILIQ